MSEDFTFISQRANLNLNVEKFKRLFSNAINFLETIHKEWITICYIFKGLKDKDSFCYECKERHKILSYLVQHLYCEGAEETR